MPSDREIKTAQQEKFYIICLLEEEYRKGIPLTDTFALLSEQAQAGMTADEIDAVRERVNRTLEKRRKYEATT